MDSSKRREPRVNKLLLTAFVIREGDEQKTPVLMGRTLNISTAGIALEVHQEVAAGSVAEMEIDLQNSLISVRGKVVRVEPTDEGCYHVGIEFDEPQEQLAEVKL